MRTIHVISALVLLWASLTYAAPLLDCETSWTVLPSSNPLQDVRDSMMFNSDGMPMGLHNLQTAIALVLAVNQKPSIEGFLKTFIVHSGDPTGVNIGREPSVCDAYIYFTLRTFGDRDEMGELQVIDRQITIPNEELQYATVENSKTTKPIWPVLVRKALDAIAINYKTLNDNKLLMGNDGTTFDCNLKNIDWVQIQWIYQNQKNKRQYLCIIADRITRLTGITLRSTPMLTAANVKKSTADITRIVDEAQGGLAIVFDQWSPTYLIKRIIKPNQNDFQLSEFEAVKLWITKHGLSQEMTYTLDNFKTENHTYQEIISSDDHRDLHLVYPYRG